MWKLQIIILRNITVAKEDDKCTESDFNTEEIRWSEFEEREPEEIFGEEVFDET